MNCKLDIFLHIYDIDTGRFKHLRQITDYEHILCI